MRSQYVNAGWNSSERLFPRISRGGGAGAGATPASLGIGFGGVSALWPRFGVRPVGGPAGWAEGVSGSVPSAWMRDVGG